MPIHPFFNSSLKGNQFYAATLSLLLHLGVFYLVFRQPAVMKMELPPASNISVRLINASELLNLPARKISRPPEVKKAQEIKEHRPPTKPLEVQKTQGSKEHAPPAMPPVASQPAEVVKRPTSPPPPTATAAKQNAKAKASKAKKTNDPLADPNFLKNLEKTAKVKQQQQAVEHLLDEGADDADKAFNAELPMSITEIDAMRLQIERHWNTSAFNVLDNPNMRVTIKVILDPGGELLSARAITTGDQSEQYHVFVESAMRAVKMAAPFQHLPSEKFASWRDTEFHFSADGILN